MIQNGISLPSMNCTLDGRYIDLFDGTHFLFMYNVQGRHKTSDHREQCDQDAGYHEELIVHRGIVPVRRGDLYRWLGIIPGHLHPLDADIRIEIADDIRRIGAPRLALVPFTAFTEMGSILLPLSFTRSFQTGRNLQ